MKKISKIILIFFLVSVAAFNFSFADNTDEVSTEPQSSEETSTQQEDTEKKSDTSDETNTTAVNTEKIEDGIKDVASKGESLAYTVIEQISDKSLPVCMILVLWGAVLYFILGIRNLYKKRQGFLLMWGALTFVVIAKIMNFAFWLAFVR